MYYVLDHCYAKDHIDFCQVVRPYCDCIYSMYDVSEILIAIQLCFEDTVSKSDNPDIDSMLALLDKDFRLETCNKELLMDDIASVLELEDEMGYQSYDIWDFADGCCVYLDMHEIWERMRGTERFKELSAKWLTPKIIEDIRKLPVEKNEQL